MRKSNRYKHLIGGFLVGICALSGQNAIYATAVVATCMELKDKLHDCMWDWVDWIITVLGGGVAALLYWLL